MSIKKKGDKVILNFGKGDIDIIGHADKKVSVISFKNIEPKEIGMFRSTNGEVHTLNEIIEESEVVMTFTRKDSLEALIKMLNMAKDKMEDI